MILKEMIKKTFNNTDAYLFLCERGVLISPGFACDFCGANVNLERGKMRHGVDGRLRCGSRYCRVSYSLLNKSIFEGSKLNFSQICNTIWSYAYGFSVRQASIETGISTKQFSGYIKYLKQKKNLFTLLNIVVYNLMLMMSLKWTRPIFSLEKITWAES
ncbi:hypothetical protein DMUE_5730 [Dictyocoela muelleri]|nr:hypothetical protein DMUE_5730 [Dictyocoela muelleri]